MTRDTPVIVLKGKKDDIVRRTMLNLGADAFLYKPLEIGRLLLELKRFIEIPEQLEFAT